MAYVHRGYRFIDGRREHRMVWEFYFGSLPSGYVIHHIDGDRLHNTIDNLRAMPTGDHSRLHVTKYRDGSKPPATDQQALNRYYYLQRREQILINRRNRPLTPIQRERQRAYFTDWYARNRDTYRKGGCKK
jgi:hypothetical protein